MLETAHIDLTCQPFPTDALDQSREYRLQGQAVKPVSYTHLDVYKRQVLKYGDQFTALPVFSTDDSRLLPEVAEGFLVTSNEIEGLELHAGHFTAINAQDQTYHDSIGLKSADVLGGSYSFNDDLSASLYYSDVEDAFKKYYGNVNYTIGLGEAQSLNFDFNIYRTKYDKEYTDTGSSEKNTIWSLAAAYNLSLIHI